MYLIPVTWIYVALMMAVAEATNSNGTVLGAIFTFLLYGVLPVGLILYFMGSPQRRRKRLKDERSVQPNTSNHAPTNPVPAVREEP